MKNLLGFNHLQQLSLQLAKTSGIFYRLREYVIKLYYSLVNSRVQYAISVWGTACKSRLQEISVRLNNIVRIIAWNNKFVHVTKLYEELKFLKLNEICQLELAKFMHQLNYDRLPDIYYNQFTKIEEIHSHDTRQVKKALYFLLRVAKSVRKLQIAYRGTKLWSEIDDDANSMHWVTFKIHCKNGLLSKY